MACSKSRRLWDPRADRRGGDDDLASHLWRVLRTPPLRCTVVFGEPVFFEPGSDRKVVAAAMQAAVTAILSAMPAPARAGAFIPAGVTPLANTENA